MCYICEYYIPGMDPSNRMNRPVCRAFSDGIPDEIMHGGYDHRQSRFDENVLFKLSKNHTAEDLRSWERETLDFERAEFLSMWDQMERIAD